MLKKYFPQLLLIIYGIEFIVAGIAPYSRSVWYAENIPILLLVLFAVFLYYRGIRFSNIAYLLMFILPFMHTIGGHYTFELVPFDWFNNLFGFERNMFDNIVKMNDFSNRNLYKININLIKALGKTKETTSLA
jgi:putative membrane protein